MTLRRTHRETLDRAIAGLLDAGVGIRPPEDKPPEVRIELFTLRSTSPNAFSPDLTGADSFKPGNIRVNMQRLLVAGAQTVRDIASAIKIPWRSPMTALILWDRLYSLLRIESKKEKRVSSG